MISRIFTNDERQILEAHLISAKVDKVVLAKIINEIQTEKSLFDDFSCIFR